MDEFGLIHTYFAPLARGFTGSLNLTDDAALIEPPSGHEIVITKDAICEGIHFIGNEAPERIAQKLLRVNLSDLAAKGATPMIYFLALMLPKNTDEAWIRAFASGLAQDQKQFNIHLAGGDTTATNGPVALSLTALGSVPKGKAIKRSGAKAGDGIYVSGTLGDAALGLKVVRQKLQSKDAAFLTQRYQLPEPRLTLGEKLRGIATACIDVSDGLAQDMAHICKASNVAAVIERAHVPLSKAAAELVSHNATLWEDVLGGGDDYELLFTAPGTNVPEGCTRIGSIKAGQGVTIVGEDGTTLPLTHKGFKHFE